jgi:hypothetical protein
MPQKIEGLHLKCYDKKPFLYSHGSRRFPPVSGSNVKISTQIKEILGQWVEPVSKENVPADVAHKIEVLYGESPVSSRIDIYGENELKGVLRSNKGSFGTCFHQSEQHFLSLLESSCQELAQSVDHFYVNSVTPLSEEGTNIANNVVVCCYNRKDMCRYCRATFSHMLHTKLMNRKVCAFVEKMFTPEPIFSTNYENIPVEIYAFSKETTEL